MSAQPEITSTQKLPFEFTGDGFEFFRIWIVNVLLSIITLGVYSAWAKVRTKRYFYRNTKVGGSAFEYHADPVKILKGRLIAFAGFAVFVVVTELQPELSPAFYLIFFGLTPWLIVRSHVFNARNSSWRNIRFDFNEENAKSDAWKVFAVYPLLIPFTLGMIFPYLSYRGWNFIFTNSRFGRQPFAFNSVRVGSYYQAFFTVVLLFAIIPYLFMQSAFSILDGLATGTTGFGISEIIFLFMIASIFLVPLPMYRLMARNISFNGATLGNHSFESKLDVWTVAWIYISNAVAIVFSVGLLIPWARVRVTRYLATHLWLNAAEDLDSFVQAEQKETSAVGQETADFMDIDIGGI